MELVIIKTFYSFYENVLVWKESVEINISF